MDNIIIDAPYEITPAMILSLKITEVVIHGTICDDDTVLVEEDLEDGDARYKHVKEAPVTFDWKTTL
jgi:hypothetical protein